MTPASTASTTLLKQFGLTTAAEELVPRLTQAGHHDALPVLVEVLEAEAEARRQRRIARLRRASRLPPGKTFATLLAERRDARRRRDYHALRGRCGGSAGHPACRGRACSWCAS